MKLLPDIAESFKIALGALLANKARGALTALGIIIGITAVITTMTAANGLKNTFMETFSAIGSDVLYISQRPWVQMGDDFEFRKRQPVSLEQASDLAERLRGQAVVNPSIGTMGKIRYGEIDMDDVRIVGTTEKSLIVTEMTVADGRFLSAFDVAAKRKVAAIGSEVAKDLFGKADPIGQRIKISGFYFRIVGVMEKEGSTFFGGPNFDLRVVIPISSYAKTLGIARGRTHIDVAVKIPPDANPKDFEYEVAGQMRSVRGQKPGEPDNFSINKLDSLMDAYNSVMGVLVAVGLAITGISLFVGGVGVMNIMFVSVTERTKEIGIRKALGAKRRSILLQFLFEAAVICLFGGLTGVALAGLVTWVIDAFVMPASLSPFIVAVALMLSMMVGLIAGLVPAFRASKLDPIDALRYE